MMLPTGSRSRIAALMRKEARQLLRDRTTLGMLLGIPLLQIILFGGAIELSPRGLNIAVISRDPQRFSQIEHIVSAGSSSVHVERESSLSSALRLQKRGETVLVLDADGLPPALYLDASNPMLATQTELLVRDAFDSVAGPVDDEAAPRFVLTRLFNADGRTQPFLVSGLLGVILTMSLVMMGALTIARERERGTLDALLSTPATPGEIWIGKLAPYILFGFIQAILILTVARVVFDIHLLGSLWLLGLSLLIFTASNLSLGFFFSCLARQQMQAMQMTFFFFLPSSLLSGFMFPFGAMPTWAQTVGEALPLTHFLRVARGLMLRDADSYYLLGEIIPIAAFGACAAVAALFAWPRVRARSTPYTI